MKTLAEWNEKPYERDWSNTFRLRTEYAVGQAGRKRTGTLTHLLHLDRIVGTLPDYTPRPGVMKVGDIFSSYAICGTRSNGQHAAGSVFPGKDTDSVNCQRCLGR